jgi:hypothetical protein
MDTLDWRMVGVLFNVCQFIFMGFIFAVLKFNDMKHLDSDLNELKKDFQSYELKNDERHIENLKSLNSLSTTVANLVGKFETFNK